eukprot:scaffold32045_cov29-Tisochrysis_lutea.AAC.2
MLRILLSYRLVYRFTASSHSPPILGGGSQLPASCREKAKAHSSHNASDTGNWVVLASRHAEWLRLELKMACAACNGKAAGHRTKH